MSHRNIVLCIVLVGVATNLNCAMKRKILNDTGESNHTSSIQQSKHFGHDNNRGIQSRKLSNKNVNKILKKYNLDLQKIWDDSLFDEVSLSSKTNILGILKRITPASMKSGMPLAEEDKKKIIELIIRQEEIFKKPAMISKKNKIFLLSAAILFWILVTHAGNEECLPILLSVLSFDAFACYLVGPLLYKCLNRKNYNLNKDFIERLLPLYNSNYADPINNKIISGKDLACLPLIDSIAYRILVWAKKLHNSKEYLSVLSSFGLDNLPIGSYLNVECINLIRCDSVHSKKYHVVSLENVLAEPEEIFFAIVITIAYHFTTEAVEQRVLAEDCTYLDIPFLTLRFIHIDANNTQVIKKTNLITKVKEIIDTPGILITCDKIDGLTSKIIDKNRVELDKNLFEEVFVAPEISLLTKLFVLYLSVVANVTPRTLFANDCITPEQQPIMPEHDVHFCHNNTTIGCSLSKNLTVTCCPQGHPSLCRSFNLLADNDDPIRSCCFVNEQGKMTCSQAVCHNSEATQSFCVSKNYEQACSNAYEGIESAPYNVARSITHYRNLFSLIQRIQSNFNLLDPAHQIQYMNVLHSYTTRGMNDQYYVGAISYANNHLQLGGAWQGTSNPDLRGILNFDSIIGHEIAHLNQIKIISENGLAKGGSSNIGIILDRPNGPGREIDADILGSLATFDINPNSILDQALNVVIIHNNFVKLYRQKGVELSNEVSNLCNSWMLPTITKNHVPPNLIQTDSPTNQHPDNLVRASILIKLDTMIKAILQSYEKQFAQAKRSKE